MGDLARGTCDPCHAMSHVHLERPEIAKMQAWRGTLVHAVSLDEIELLEDHILIVGTEGKVLAMCHGDKEEPVLQQHGLTQADVHQLQRGQMLTPGFIDLHLHAPQYSYAGTATDLPLMEWLDHYTFPREAAHSHREVAEAEYRQLVRRTLANGTTTALFFGALHLEACKLLASICLELGQRALVGLVCMDRNSPDTYTKSTEQNLADTEAFIQHVRGLGSDLVQPVVTPRFVPTCTPELLAGLGEVAQGQAVLVQSHISESHDEVAFVEALHPGERDASILQQHGLLQRSVMAHGTCLRDHELNSMASAGAAIAHCPLSNFFFGDEILAVRDVLAHGVAVGLGTDVAGGYSPCMLHAIRTAVVASRALRSLSFQGRHGAPLPQPELDKANSVALDFKGGFWLATVGGARALGLEDQLGTFAVGKQADLLLIDTTVGSTFDVHPRDTVADLFQKFMNLGDDRNIAAVYVSGRRVLPHL